MTDDLPWTTAVYLANYSITTSKNACTIAQAIAVNVTTCSDTSSPQCTASFWIYAVCVPVLLVFGTTGNVLTMLVMAKRSMGRTAFGTYILAIAISDTLVLWICLPRHFVRWLWLIDLRELSPWSCRTLRYLQFSLMHTSAWLLVTVTTERFLNIYYPTKFRLHKTRRRAACVASCVALFHFAWNAHIFWTLGEELLDGCRLKQCGYPAAFAFYWTHVHTWLDLVKLSLLPFVIMLCMNVAIIVSLRKRVSPSALQALRRNGRGFGVQRLRPLANAVTSSSNGSPVARLHTQSGGEQRPSAESRNAPLPSSSADSTKTAMLLWVSFFYVIMTVPTFVATILELSNSAPLLLSSIATVAFYTNNTFNFILYSLSGATFRRMFLATVSRRRRFLSSSTITSSVLRSTIGHQSRLYIHAIRHHSPEASVTEGSVVGECNGNDRVHCNDAARRSAEETASNGLADRNEE